MGGRRLVEIASRHSVIGDAAALRPLSGPPRRFQPDCAPAGRLPSSWWGNGGAALRLGRQEVEPDRADLEFGPLGIQFGAVERKVLGAMLLLIGLGPAFQLAIGLVGWMLRFAGGLPLMAVFTALSMCAAIYVYGRFMLLVPRAGFGGGTRLAETWRLTRAALFPLAWVAFIPQILTTPLSLLVRWIRPPGGHTVRSGRRGRHADLPGHLALPLGRADRDAAGAGPAPEA